LNSNLKHYIGYGLALVLIGLFLRFYIQEKEGRLRAEGEQRVVAARDQAQKEATAHFEELIKGLKTPEQAKPLIQQGIQSGSGKKEPLKPFLSVPRSSLTPEAQKSLPDAPEAKPDDSIAILTPDQQVDLGKRELSCEETEGKLSTCEQDKLNLQNEINDLKGGSVFRKVVREAKCLGFLGLGSAAGSKFGGWKGAAIGGAAAEVVCKIVF
jgi:hypothetical protein